MKNQQLSEMYEIPKYYKMKNSKKSKSKKKSDHKHTYEECLIRYYYHWYKDHEKEQGNLGTKLCSYCTICGKIGTKLKKSNYSNDCIRTTTSGIEYHSILSGEELYEKYHNELPVFFLEDMYDEYVNLE